METHRVRRVWPRATEGLFPGSLGVLAFGVTLPAMRVAVAQRAAARRSPAIPAVAHPVNHTIQREKP